MKKSAWITCLVILVSCTSIPKIVTIHAQLADSVINISGIDKSIIDDIGRDSSGSVWESLLSVYRMPADTDMKDYQPVQSGTYKVKDSLVVFKPDTPFVAGQTYFVRYHRFDAGSSPWDYIRGRKKLNSVPHTDLVLKR